MAHGRAGGREYRRGVVYGIADGITAQLPEPGRDAGQRGLYHGRYRSNSALGIASPSKVFEQIGQYAGEGMAGGMAAMQAGNCGRGRGPRHGSGGWRQWCGEAAGGVVVVVILPSRIPLRRMNVPAGRGPLTGRQPAPAGAAD